MVDFEENVEEMVWTTREAADGDRVRHGRDGDETGGPGYETGDKTAATADDKRVAEFTRCTRWPGQPSIIDPVTNASNVKKALCI